MSEPLEKRLDSFEASLRFMSDKYEDMQRKLNQLEEQNRQLNFENKSLKFHVDTLTQNVRELESEIEEQQQYSRRDCLEFKNIPELEDESTNEIVVTTCLDTRQPGSVFKKLDTRQSEILTNFLQITRLIPLRTSDICLEISSDYKYCLGLKVEAFNNGLKLKYIVNTNSFITKSLMINYTCTSVPTNKKFKRNKI